MFNYTRFAVAAGGSLLAGGLAWKFVPGLTDREAPLVGATVALVTYGAIRTVQTFLPT